MVKWTNHCRKWNSQSHRMKIKSQSILAQSFFGIENYECWNCTTFSLNFLTERVGTGHRFAVSCSCGEGFGRLYPTGNQSREGATAAKKFQ